MQHSSPKHPFNGWLNIDKEVDYSSGQVVYQLRKILGMKKIGHGGTLDPFATGILPIALGEATKTVDYLHTSAKTYLLTIRFGTATNTDDCTGEVIHHSDKTPSLNEVEAILPDFQGDIAQIPSAFSAIKIDGKRAYKMARAGETVTMPSRIVHIYNLQLKGINADGDMMLEVVSGKGAYMRSIARDIAEKLGSRAHLHALRRTAYGTLTEKNSFSLENVEKMMHKDKIDAILQPIHKALDGILVLNVNQEQALRLKSGNAVQVNECAFLHENSPINKQNKQLLLAVMKQTSETIPIAIAELVEDVLVPKRVFNF